MCDLQQSIQNVPLKPGVYLMKSDTDTILYIGKAKNLKKRLQSYMRPTQNKKTAIMMSKVRSVEYLITHTEYEALLLENNLIKQHRPHYNIDLKDGKTYPVIRITNEEYPRVFKTRYMVQDKSKYYGPFPAGEHLRTYLALIEKLYPLRRCKKKKLVPRKQPCLYHHMQLCAAPCAGKISYEDYQERIQQIVELLEGRTEQIMTVLKEKMNAASSNMEFERAREYRDMIQSIVQLHSEQSIVDFKENSRDYIACASESNHCAFVIFRMREGKLINSSTMNTVLIGELEDHYTEFLQRYYQDIVEPPNSIYVQYAQPVSQLKQFFRQEHGANIQHVRSLHDSRIMNMAIDNAWTQLRKRSDTTKMHGILQDLQKLLNLPTLPMHIEGFDIAHIGGKHTVAAMVHFINGKPSASAYRKYHIKSMPDGKIDDFESLREVIARRYMRIKNENLTAPDLILVDGGKGQLHAAREILISLNMHETPIIGLAKQHEEIFVPDVQESIQLPAGDAVLRLLQHIRDEAHRFATTFRKNLQTRELETSLLQRVRGIGPQRAQRILERFESVGNILAVPPEILAKTTGMGLQQAKEIQLLLQQAKDTSGQNAVDEQ